MIISLYGIAAIRSKDPQNYLDHPKFSFLFHWNRKIQEIMYSENQRDWKLDESERIQSED